MSTQHSEGRQQTPRLMHITCCHVQGSPRLGGRPIPCCGHRLVILDHCNQVQQNLLAWPAHFTDTAESPTRFLSLLPVKIGGKLHIPCLCLEESTSHKSIIWSMTDWQGDDCLHRGLLTYHKDASGLHQLAVQDCVLSPLLRSCPYAF